MGNGFSDVTPPSAMLSTATGGSIAIGSVVCLDTPNIDGLKAKHTILISDEHSDNTLSTEATSQCSSCPEEVDAFSVPSSVNVTPSLSRSSNVDESFISEELIGLTRSVEAQFESELLAINLTKRTQRKILMICL